MNFAVPLGLLGLLAVPAVLLLHLYRRRLAERQVAGLFLWAPDRLAAEAGRRRTRLLRTASLWLELLAAVVLAFWLAGPRLGVAVERAHLVLVLDDSASMQAVVEADERVADRARAAATRRLDELPRDARVSVLRSGERPELLAGPRALAGAALRALDDWQPLAPEHDPAVAFDLALELAGTDPGVSVEWFTDGLAETALPPGVGLRAFGAVRPNVAILTARRLGVTADEEQLLLDLQVHGGSVRSMQVTVESVAGEFAARSFDVALEPGGPPARLAPRLPRGAGAWRVSLPGGEANVLDVDDRAVLLPEPDRRLTAASMLSGEAAAQLRVEQLIAALDGVELLPAADVGLADLCFTGSEEGPGADQHQVLIAPLPGETDPWIGPYLVERRHPLGKGVGLDGVVWSAGRGEVSGTPIAWAGSQVLIAEQLTGQGTLRLRLQLDPLRTNLAASPDWPILIDNFAARIRSVQPGPVTVNVSVGEPLEYRLRRPATEAWRLRGPGGEERAAPVGGRLLSWRGDRPGLHDLIDPTGAVVQRFAVTFVDPAESDLGGRSSQDLPAARRPARAESATTALDGAVERRVLALLLLLLVAADWWVLRSGRRG